MTHDENDAVYERLRAKAVHLRGIVMSSKYDDLMAQSERRKSLARAKSTAKELNDKHPLLVKAVEVLFVVATLGIALLWKHRHKS